MNKTVRILALFLMLCLLPPGIAQEKYTSMPKIFVVKSQTEEWYEANNTQYYAMDRVTTTNKTVNEEIRKVVDSFETLCRPLIVAQSQEKPKIYNRLDVDVNYFRTGESALSTLIIARNTHKRVLKDVFLLPVPLT